MKYHYLVFLFLIFSSSFSQLEAVVIDAETKEEIPYVNIWVLNENIGTTSDKKGKFSINLKQSKVLVFSAIGYERKRVEANSIETVVEMTPEIYELEEVIVHSTQSKKEIKVGEFEKHQIKTYHTSGNKPKILARYYEYKAEYAKTRFIQKIKILTDSRSRNAKFKIVLLGVDENGKPDKFLNKENIIGKAKKGKKFTEIDISDLQVKFPETGVVIGIEWLIIDKNEFVIKHPKKGLNKMRETKLFSPNLGTIKSTKNETWIYTYGKWSLYAQNKNNLEKLDKAYDLLALEITLTNIIGE